MAGHTKMAQTGFTPISIYYSATATNVPTAGNLVAGELAINTADGKLFYKDSAGVVQTIASKDTNSGTFTNISVNGVASFADGTVSLPSITNIGDTNTGMYFPAADTIAFTEGGVESMRIDSSGILNLTNNPILSAGTANGITYLNASKSLTTSSALTFDGTQTLLLNATGNAVVNLDGSGTNNAILRLRNATTGNLAGIFANNSKELIFEANGAVEQMRLTSTGLGIGTSSPNASAILDVQSTTKGVRMPNMTTAEKNAIASPAAGLMVFDTTLAKLCVYSGSAWQTITSL